MGRSKGRHRRLIERLDEPTPATKSWPPFGLTCRYNHGALPPLGDYGMFLEEHRRFFDGARNIPEAVVASTQDAAMNRRPNCLEDHGTASFLDLQWPLSKGLEPAVRKTILDRKLAVGRPRRVAASNTWLVCDGPAVKSVPADADALLLSETTTKTSALQEFTPGKAKRTGGSLKRRSAPKSTDDVGIKDESPKTKTPRLEVRGSGTVGPMDVCEVRAEPQAHAAMDSKSKDIDLGKPKESDTQPA
ncbi:hypothetical protein HPB52_006864 [Rhipicephalus sanguineus]|uniref:Uncharacterized protein n=1 Tax=Rhipicephalus sanguineus TaxID=34632 RepID=A0A9D4T8R1_RHISA|nr:hypothetical protein HPB52_006864 [Rhipicephalus sanguineus]